MDDNADLERRVTAADRPRVSRATLHFGRVVIIGGGCYGSWYAQQLARAIAHGALVAQDIVVVDRDPDCRVGVNVAAGAYAGTPIRLEVAAWADYLEAWLGQGREVLAHDAMVPSPLMPHLCLDWLMARARTRWPERSVAIEPLPATPPMPWERAAPDGRHYVSFATWICPVNCIEPVRCPATRGPRDWSMPTALATYVAEQHPPLDGSLIFHCEHRTFGVGMIDAAQIAEAAETMTSRGDAVDARWLVGTVSHCHGALGLLTVS